MSPCILAWKMPVFALAMLAVSEPYVMAAQALSGIAKDLNKMSAKASVKTLVSADADARLFKWLSFRDALLTLAGGLLMVLITTFLLLPKELGKAKAKPRFTQVSSNSAAINWLSAARFFLFGARDIWFVVALPVFLINSIFFSKLI